MAESDTERRLVARLAEVERPREVIDLAAAIMAERFRDDGFVWVKSRQTFRRVAGERRESFMLQRSAHNSTGVFISFAVAALEVSDERLRAWRLANPDLTPARDASMLAVVAASSFYDLSHVHEAGRTADAILTRPQNRTANLDLLCGHIRRTALPWFAASRDPDQLAHTVPDALLRPWGWAVDLVEFLVSTGHHEQAGVLIDRVLAQGDKHATAFAAGRAMAHNAQRPAWHTAESLGWTCTTLGIR